MRIKNILKVKMICFTEFQLIVILLGIVFMMYSIYSKQSGNTPPEKSSHVIISNDSMSREPVVRMQKEFKDDFPFGKYIGTGFGNGCVGYLLDGSSDIKSPLYLQRFHSKYYYYANLNDVNVELDKNPLFIELMDGDPVAIHGKPYTAKIYKTNF